MSDGNNNFYYHYDPLGSVANLTSSSGASDWTYGYEPFGSSRTTVQNDPNAPANPMQFTGEYVDPTGFYNLRARAYDPSVGRFLTTDPLPPKLSDPYVSAYVYANNRPTLLVDPSGQLGVPGWGAVKRFGRGAYHHGIETALGATTLVGGTALIGLGVAVGAGCTVFTEGVAAYECADAGAWIGISGLAVAFVGAGTLYDVYLKGGTAGTEQLGRSYKDEP